MSSGRDFIRSIGGLFYAAGLMLLIGAAGAVVYVALSYPPARTVVALGAGVLVVGAAVWAWGQRRR